MMIHRIRELRAEGYRTAILTNNVREWGRYWKGSIPLELFDVVVDSCDVGLRKPDPSIFRLTCRRLGVVPEAAVFLDDTRNHVEAARQVGLHAILVRDPRDALAELDAILETAAA
jgi:putative hydrolase of the HAD superfamily